MGTNGSPAADGAPGSGPPSTSTKEPVDSPVPALGVMRAIDRPMNLPEIQAAAEHALLNSITDDQLHKALSSADEFEVNLEICCLTLVQMVSVARYLLHVAWKI